MKVVHIVKLNCQSKISFKAPRYYQISSFLNIMKQFKINKLLTYNQNSTDLHIDIVFPAIENTKKNKSEN